MNERVTTEYLAIMDADDMMHPERLSKQLGILKRQQNINLVDNGCYSFDRDYIPTSKRCTGPYRQSPFVILEKSYMLHGSITGRTSWFANKRYNETILRAVDKELLCRNLDNILAHRITEPLYFVRELGEITTEKCYRSLRGTIHILKVHGPRLIGRLGTYYLMAKIHIKFLVQYSMIFFGQADIIANRRNSPISQSEKEEAHKIIEGILATEVQGI